MQIRLTNSFERDYRTLPTVLQKAVDQKLLLLLENFKSPSLQIKKMKGYTNVWEARVNRGSHFTFSIVGKAYLIRRVGPHDVLRKP